MKITKEELAEIEKLYAWELLRNNDAKFGRVFLTTYPDIKQCLADDGDHGIADLMVLWAESDVEKSRELVKRWVK
jgi:ribosomal 50S subunit-associated protein YjgA (DUF615 family)